MQTNKKKSRVQASVGLIFQFPEVQELIFIILKVFWSIFQCIFIFIYLFFFIL